jgi:TatD DNase family protein
MEELKAAPPTAPFLMHSFGGSIELARELLELGAYFSLSGYFLQPRKAKVLEVFKQLPKERILIETDAPDMAPPVDLVTHSMEDELNHPANLPATGEALAGELGMPPQELAFLIKDNTRACFQL